MDIRERLKEIDGLMSGAAYARKWDEDREKRESGQYEVDRLVEGQIVHNDGGEHFVAVTNHVAGHVHGTRSLNSALTVSPAALAVIGNDADLAGLDISTAAFIDTETTGIAGGTGTHAFMVGAGRFTSSAGFEVRQFFMRDFDEEESMLSSLAEWLDGVSALVSYNGKSFDIPLLRTRFITSRLRVNLDDMPHLDLLHAARRLWKRRLGDCSLVNIEGQVLGVERHGDVPGSVIPQLYFDYVRSRDARPLVPAFSHNVTDVLSMVTLTTVACEMTEGAEEHCAHPDDRLSLARLYFRQGEMRRVVAHASQVLDDVTVKDTAQREAMYLTGFSFKKLAEWKESSLVWSRLIEAFPDELVPRIELAKYHEHRSRDLGQAACVCEEALNRLKVTHATTGEEPDDSSVQEFTRRLKRIHRKIGNL